MKLAYPLNRTEQESLHESRNRRVANAAPAWLRLVSVAWACIVSEGRCEAAGIEEYWPQFRGPNCSGTSKLAKPPVKIGPAEAVAWKIAVPWSPSSPCVWSNRVFLTTYHDQQFETRAYSTQNGRLLWNRGVKVEKIEDYHSTDGSPAASTPATDGKRVVSYFGSFGVLCHDLEGKELWRHGLPMAISGGSYGSGTSPIIVGDRVFLNRDQDMNSSLLAFSLRNGKILWETARPEFIGGFGTPIVWRNAGVDEIVMPGSVVLKAYHPVSGKERWTIAGVSTLVCTTPVAADGMLYFGAWSPGKADSSFPTDWPKFVAQFDSNGDGQVLLSEFDPVRRDFIRGIDKDRDGKLTDSDLGAIRKLSARAENVLIAVRPGGKGDITKSHVAWTHGRGLPYVSSPIYYGGRIYVIKDGGMLTSVDAASGKAVYVQERIGAIGNYYASPVAADGRLYVASLPGKVTVIKAGGETPEILHQADFGERIFATPAVVGNRIYLRTQAHLYAFQN